MVFKRNSLHLQSNGFQKRVRLRFQVFVVYLAMKGYIKKDLKLTARIKVIKKKTTKLSFLTCHHGQVHVVLGFL